MPTGAAAARGVVVAVEEEGVWVTLNVLGIWLGAGDSWCGLGKRRFRLRMLREMRAVRKEMKELQA